MFTRQIIDSSIVDDGEEKKVDEPAGEGVEQAEGAKPKPEVRKLCVLSTTKPRRVYTSIQYRTSQFVILEALSATGLRSIRYAKEIPQVK